METEARTAKVKEFEERLTLVEKLRAANCIPVWDKEGNMRVLKAPANYDWDGLTRAVVQADDLALTDNETKKPLDTLPGFRAGYSTMGLIPEIQGGTDIAPKPDPESPPTTE